MKNIIYTYVFCLLFSCYESDLPNHYYFLSSFEASDIGYPYGSIIYKSNIKNVFQKVVVYSDIIKYKVNKKSIIVIQKPNIQFAKKQLADEIEFWNKYYKNNRQDSIVEIVKLKISVKYLNDLMMKNHLSANNIADSIIQSDSYYKSVFANPINYWILMLNSDSLVGPLSKKNFIMKKEELGISDLFDY